MTDNCQQRRFQANGLDVKGYCVDVRAIVWMLRAILWMLRAILWMLIRAILWMLRAIVWMLLRAVVWMLRASAPHGDAPFDCGGDGVQHQAPESTVGQPMAVCPQGIYVEYSVEYSKCRALN
eukprot:941945-Prorocentrum_minimum.AAC.1